VLMRRIRWLGFLWLISLTGTEQRIGAVIEHVLSADIGFPFLV
jgi:hypothetical protein